MSELKDRIRDDMKAAMRSGAKVRLQTIRMLMAEIKQREVDERLDVDDLGVIAIIERMIRQRRDAQNQYRAANRPELAEAEANEIEQLAAYLPPPLSAAELDSLIEQALSETGAANAKDMGKVMAWLRPRVSGRADMGLLSGRVKARLA